MTGPRSHEWWQIVCWNYPKYVWLFWCHCRALMNFLASCFLANSSTSAGAAPSILKQMWAAFSGIQYDWPSKARRPFFTATNYATINLTGVSRLHWSQRRDSGFQLVRDMKGGGGDECPWASAWWIGQGVDEESGMVRLCAKQTPGPFAAEEDERRIRLS